eukprot:18116-Heterococcus_DN1.PRE.1
MPPKAGCISRAHDAACRLKHATHHALLGSTLPNASSSTAATSCVLTPTKKMLAIWPGPCAYACISIKMNAPCNHSVSSAIKYTRKNVP